MRVSNNLITGLFLCLMIVCAALIFTASPAMAEGETCSNGKPSPCFEDVVISGCDVCHSLQIEHGNRDGTDRFITAAGIGSSVSRHIHDPLIADWTSIVNAMIGKNATGDPQLMSGYLNTNYCPTCTGPILGSPVQSNVQPTSATVTWSTSFNGFEDEPTNTVLYYATNPADLFNVATATTTDGKFYLFDPSTFHCSGTCQTFTDSTLIAHHVVNLTGLNANTRYYLINEATSGHGTTRSTYAYSFKTKPLPVGAVPPFVYLSDAEGGSGSSDRVIIIDPATNTQVLPSIVVTGNNPAEIASHPDAETVYVMAGQNLSVIDVPTKSEFASLVGVGDSANHLAVSSDGHRLYLVYRDLTHSTLKIKVYDTTDSHGPVLLTTITNPVFDGCVPLGVIVSPDGGQVYTACRPSTSGAPDQFYMVDTASNTPTMTATFSRDSSNNTSINAMAITPDGSEVFVARDDGSPGGHASVEVFDGSTGANVASIILPNNATPRAGVLSLDGSTLYVVDQALGIHLIDAVGNTYLSTTAPSTSRGLDIGILPDGSSLYTSLSIDVFVNDTGTNSPVKTIMGSFNNALQLTVTPGRAAPPTPDVLMTDVTPNAASVSPGNTLSVTDTVKNQGTASTDSSFFMAYSLSTNTTYGDGDDVAITTTRVVGSLAPGATDTATTDLLIPSSTPPGTYYICALADSTSALAESNVDNNSLCSTAQVLVTKPDLVMTDVTPNSSGFAPGGTLSVTDTVKNQGGAPTFVSSTIAYSLSTDTTYGNGDDIAITTTRAVGALAAGASNTATTNLLIPSSTPPGTYHVCAKADSANAVSEADETNNSLCSTLTVGPATPDLIMSAVSTTATAAAPGGSFTLSNTAKNQGTASAGSFTVGYYLSVNSDGSTQDVAFTATRTVSSLAAGATSTASTSLAVPSLTPLGPYYVCATADKANSVLEGVETNNSLCTGTTIQVTRPDLIVTAVTPNSGTVSPTATLSVTDSVKNQGIVSAGSSKVGYSLSVNTTCGDGDDIAITTTRTIASLAGGATSTATTTLTIPNTTPTGIYHVCAIADSANTVTELPPNGETNNTLLSGATVSVPQSDLIVSAASTTATLLAPGNSFTLPNTVTNQGAFPAGSFTVGYYLSVNVDGSTQDVAFTTTRTVTSLAGGASSAATTSLSIPAATPLATYYVCVMADSANTVAESNETNNSLCTSTTIQVTRSDLIMTAVTPGAGTVNQGATLSVTNTVNNQGLVTTGAAFRVGFYLSINSDGSTQDVAISTIRSVTALATGASSTGTTSLAIPATTPPGTYYVCALADSLNQVVETNETNNTLCSSGTVNVPPPDLVMTAASTTATTVNKGANFTLSNSVKNQGGSKAGAFVIGFHLSTDTTYGNGDDVVITQTRSVTSLAIGATSTASTTLTVPSSTPTGTYYVCMMADNNNTVAEGDETNNSRCTATPINVP